MRSLAKFAWATLAFNIFVILAGAVVRATGSGAGCGASWPDCDGQLVPDTTNTAQVIEYVHRIVSGVALLLVVVLCMWVFRLAGRKSQLRKAAIWSLVTILGEAAIGAMIVVAEWVADDVSLARGISVPLHLVNTLLLLAALTATAWLAEGNQMPRRSTDPALARHVTIGIVGMVIIAATGAITALADTLFPSESVFGGFIEDFSGSAEILVRLRILHPIVAIAVGLYVASFAFRHSLDATGKAQRFGLAVAAIVVTQIFAGMANVVLLTPVWMQVIHLLLADLLWIGLLLFGAAALQPTEVSVRRLGAVPD